MEKGRRALTIMRERMIWKGINPAWEGPNIQQEWDGMTVQDGSGQSVRSCGSFAPSDGQSAENTQPRQTLSLDRAECGCCSGAAVEDPKLSGGD